LSDALLKFLFDGAPVRAEAVRLRDAWRQMIALHDYPPPVARLLGEMTAAAALLSTTIKFNGALILQIHGDGPVKLLVVECQPDLALRATAKLRAGAHVPDDAGLRELVNATGHGRCAITLDPKDPQPGQQPYQGIVPLEGASIAQALESYMRRSEQLDTRLWLAADGAGAAGLLLQRLPREGGRTGAGDDGDAWQRAVTLASTLGSPELLSIGPDELVRRLYWQERLDAVARLTPRFQCTCSRARIGRMLVSLGREEVDSIVAELGSVIVTCDFCNARHAFDAVDVVQLFSTGSTEPGAQDSLH
jgi:molecular chaperone Hsp33